MEGVRTGKVAIESVDRAMRGQTSPAPIYEGKNSVIAWMLEGPNGSYTVSLPDRGEAKRAILANFTKEHSAEYQSQAWIDLARKLHHEHPELLDGERIESVVTHSSHHTHDVIGSGVNDPQKYDSHASRETLDTRYRISSPWPSRTDRGTTSTRTRPSV